MATLALSLAGQVVGGAIGGPIGATIGRALGALAGNAVDQALFGGNAERRQGSDIRLTGSSEGGPIARLYGWNRVAGNIVWATQLERIAGETRGAKAMGGAREEDTIVASFALALCEGPVAHLGRIWADGKLLEAEGLTIRFYRGTEDQGPDSLIEAKQGSGNAPAYRGLCYLVFERLPLTAFGNRIPNISVELCRPAGDLEPAIRAVCVIPGSTEFGYDPVPRVRILGRGKTASENAHLSAARSDWDLSIDELTALCPNLEHVGLVVSWFGTDLRCGECVVEPRVESAGRSIKGVEWAVAGRSRAEANAVSSHEGAPAYGGTPSDASIIAAIADLKARGLKVTLYPFVMMDVPAGNGLTDPYTLGSGQPAYPWRGRITCHPAPGIAGSPDGTSGAGAQVAAFLGNGYREMVLHYARLARDAGGVDAILIGSEMRELTSVRSGAVAFPFVDGLRALAGEVRGIAGGGTKITYAADWSEYFGMTPAGAPGDRIFHLDPLWADENIDAVGIDDYMPLADWRDDAEEGSIYDTDYLAGNIAGGEGFDWYYASDADRGDGVRTPITDGAGEPWIWRYKDLVSWWGSPHHDRVGGVRSETPTAWVPEGKPVWLTELGCAAVDKGPNAPNAFGDAKSSEDALPPFSTGLPDPLVQRQMLRACHMYWQGGDEGRNPVSGVYGGAMLDPERLYLWCWDARPFPAFPGLPEVWADADNHATGHWLNGRLGAAGTGEMLAALAADFGVAIDRVDARPPLVEGLAVEAVTSMREAGAALIEASGLVVRDGVEGLSFIAPDRRKVLALGEDDLVRGDGPVLARRRGDPAERPGRLALGFADRLRDYQTASVLAMAEGSERGEALDSGLVMGPAEARLVAEGALRRARIGEDGIEMRLPPSLLALEPGDLVAVEGVAGEPALVSEIRDGDGRAVGCVAFGETAVATVAPPQRRISVTPPLPGAEPEYCFAHLPAADGGTELLCGAFAEPWPGTITLRDMAGTDVAALGGAATIGLLDAPLAAGPVGIWSQGEDIVLTLLGGHLSSLEPRALLDAGNRLAVEGEAGRWEVIGFAGAVLIGPGQYRLSGLLRGLRGTTPVAAEPGARAMLVGYRTSSLPVPQAALGTVRGLRAYAGPRDIEGTALTLELDSAPALPLAPVHLAARREEGGDVMLSWIRRTRVDGDGWTVGDVPLDFSPEAYRVTILDGEAAVRSFETAAPMAVYAAADQIADFGALPASFGFAVRQLSPVLGPGAIASGDFA